MISETWPNGIASEVKNLGLDSEKLIVVGGAAMQMYGMKETSDIDLVVS